MIKLGYEKSSFRSDDSKMMFEAYKLLFVALVSFVFALDNVSHQDLENPNGKICGWGSSCLRNNSVPNTSHLPDFNCLCDPECVKYGDCCLDSPFFNSAEQRRAVSQYNCFPIEDFFHIYRRDSCPAAWKDSRTRGRCEKSTSGVARDPLLITPVTNTYTNTTYGNVYCAACNGDAVVHRHHLVYWEQGIRCVNDGQPLPPQYDRDYVENNMRYNETIDSWQVRTEKLTYTCGLTPLIPNKLKRHVRRCVPTVKTCPATWSREDIRDRCESYTLVVNMIGDPANYGSGQTANYKWYRNVHCAMCNNVPVQALQCAFVEVDPRFKADIPSFTILFDFTGGSTVGYLQPCAATQVYDRFFRLCRNVVAEYDDLPEDERAEGADRVPQKCTKILLQPSEFRSVDANAIYVAKYSRTFVEGEFHMSSGGAVEICSKEFASSVVPKYRPYLSLLTAFGIGVSIICLCLHLIVFATLQELRNLSGKNMASMCVALLAGYCSFAASAWLRGKGCLVNAVITYYFFLATFAWTLVMAFDVWRTLRIATKELRVSAGTQWRKFFIYSLCSWVLPAKIVLIAVLVDLCPAGLVAESLKPHFGQGHCWFGRGYAIALFFGLPLFVILVSNLSFFLSSAYMVYSSHSMVKYSASPNTKSDFKLYAKLALIMGLTWIVGVVAGFADVELLWVVFVLLNTTLGLFIFVAFTCRSKILRALKSMRKDNVLTLPVFNWSTGSTDDSKVSAPRGEKKTSTTYY